MVAFTLEVHLLWLQKVLSKDQVVHSLSRTEVWQRKVFEPQSQKLQSNTILIMPNKT